jgi:dinuclear metal center YbgI/SA1388 family protein
MKIKDVTTILERLAPLSYQESYDNSGLIIGDRNDDLKSILITLDCTEEVLDEAIKNKCNLIVAHHPILFKSIKKLNGDNYVQRVIIKAIKNNISIYAIHTNLDNVMDGVNSTIANRLELINCKILQPKYDILKQLIVYCPESYSKKLKESLFSLGAGAIGDYEQCSFSSKGIGTFFPKKDSKPFIGDIGKVHEGSEDCIEMIFPKNIEGAIIECINKNHPYEEVAYQIFNLDIKYKNVGSGLIGELKESIEEKDFLSCLKDKMNTSIIRHTNLRNKKIKKVAVCGGAGSFLLSTAISKNADIFISSDFKYHEFFDADNKLVIADIGHFESEQYTKDLIYDFLRKKITKFAVRLSQVNTNPINYI